MAAQRGFSFHDWAASLDGANDLNDVEDFGLFDDDEDLLNVSPPAGYESTSE
jgi:hypothetical protein